MNHLLSKLRFMLILVITIKSNNYNWTEGEKEKTPVEINTYQGLNHF